MKRALGWIKWELFGRRYTVAATLESVADILCVCLLGVVVAVALSGAVSHVVTLIGSIACPLLCSPR